MPKSRNRRKKRGPNKGPKIPSMAEVEALAKALDTPELRELYRRQKRLNPNLDKEIDELSKDVQEIFNHDKSSKE